MSTDTSDLLRYDSLLGEARHAMVRLAGLERDGVSLDPTTRAALIDALESGLSELAPRRTSRASARQAARAQRLAALVREAHQVFAELGEPVAAAPVSEPLSLVRVDSQA